MFLLLSLLNLVIAAEQPNNPYEVSNCSIASSVAANAITFSIKTRAGNTPTTGDPCIVSFRNETLTTGTYSRVKITANTTLTIASGSTLGMTSGVEGIIYVYAINNSGTVVLGVSGMTQVKTQVLSASADTGGIGDVAGAVYANSSYNNKSYVVLGSVIITEATAGTWATAPTQIISYPNTTYSTPVPTIVTYTSGTSTYYPPANVAYIKVKAVAGGGGGTGGGSVAGTAPTAGGNTTFGSILTVTGGAPGVFQSLGGSGGSGTLSSPAIGNVYGGGSGSGGALIQGGYGQASGGSGGNSILGGAGGGANYNNQGYAAKTNSGSGGGAGGSGTSTTTIGGSGGGAGGSAEFILTRFDASYGVVIGAGGSAGGAGTGGNPGGAGAAGIVIIEEYYK